MRRRVTTPVQITSTPPHANLWLIPPSTSLCIDLCGSRCCRNPSGGLHLTYAEIETLFPTSPLRSVMETDTTIFRTEAGGFLLFADTGGQCPHLLNTGLCAVYEQRPIACRGFPWGPEPDCLVWPKVT